MGGLMGRWMALLALLFAAPGKQLQPQSPPPARQPQEEAVQRMARDLVPQVERAVGLKYRRPPAVALRSRDQVRAFVSQKIAEQLPPPELDATQRAYRAFGLVADTTDLRRLMLDLYGEQVAGYYDPDSSVLYIVRGAEPMMVRFILAHELVHALQDQYTPLNAILKLHRQNDRQMAGQAVTEGQATLASMQALAQGRDLGDLSGMWRQVREGIRSQQESMPVFASAPRIIQEGLLFPYLAGADFVRGFYERRALPDEVPYGDRMPISTEQVLHPGKYSSRERPARLRLAAPAGDTLIYDDDFGEFETRIALETWGVGEEDALAAASGWNGDRFEILGTRSGTALAWVVAWDTPADAAEFESALRIGWQRRTGARPGRYGTGRAERQWQVDALTLGGVPVVRLVDAPAAWTGWRALPSAQVGR
jgi:hypothetical protein